MQHDDLSQLIHYNVFQSEKQALNVTMFLMYKNEESHLPKIRILRYTTS